MKSTFKKAFTSSVAGILLSIASLNASAFSLEGTLWSNAPNKTNPYLLYAIALAESKKTDETKRNVRPWPWAVNVQGKGHWFDTREEAEAFVMEHYNRGIRNIDVGIMQINLRWHGHRVSHPLDLFDMETAIRVGEEILLEAIASAPGDMTLGVGRYHHWEHENVSRQYGNRVLGYKNAIDRLSRGG